MKNLKAKLRKNGGFTLIEMLIVVAIIAILVAISIPMINTSLEKAREATDDANLRSAKAEAAIVYLSGDADDNTYTPGNAITGKYYDIKTGKLVGDKPNDYAQATATKTKGTVIAVSVTADGVVTCQWSNS